MSSKRYGEATWALSEYATGLRMAEIPDHVIEHVQLMTQNIVAAALWGLRLPGPKRVARGLTSLGGTSEAQIIGTNIRTAAPYAAAIHAGAAFATMSDDTHFEAQIHVGHSTIPAAFAVGQACKRSNEEILTAIVAGNEVAIRIAYSVGPTQSEVNNSFRAGFWSEIKCTFAAAVTAGKLFNLSPAEMASAIGIAATSSSGLLSTGYGVPPQSTPCGSVIAWDAAKATMLGIQAAQLAKLGMTVAPEPLEGRQGWVRTYARGYGDVAALTHQLDEFETRKIALKAHCMSHTSFGYVDATAELVQSHGLQPRDIAEIIVIGPSYLSEFLWRTRIESYEDAVCSTPFCVGMAVLEPGPLTLPSQVAKRLSDPEMETILDKISHHIDDTFKVNAGPLGGAVSITLRDGTALSSSIKTEQVPNLLEIPLLAHKLREAARGRLASAAVEPLIMALHRFPSGQSDDLWPLLEGSYELRPGHINDLDFK